ncbi:F0F1 ATP synthase subunit B [Candidatus Uhrbacteria bacterium]|nr:F0F1 ATP synthase subunit B [Candidatus Uhrbacteria bacterium]
MESPGLLGTLGIDAKLFIAQLVNFSILVLALWKWAYKPLLAKMEEREKKIREGLVFSEDAARMMREMEEEKEQALQRANAEAQLILEHAHARAEAASKERIEAAKREIGRLRDEQTDQLSRERQSVMASIKTDAADLIAGGVRKILSGIEPDVRDRIVKKGIDDLKRSGEL